MSALRFAIADFGYSLGADNAFSSGGVEVEFQVAGESMQISWTTDGLTYKDLIYYENNDGPHFGIYLSDAHRGLDQIQALVPDCVYEQIAGYVKAWRMGLL